MPQLETDAFVASDWLECGRIFEQNHLPSSVRCEIKQLLTVPASIRSTIPLQTLSVMQLLDTNFVAALDHNLNSKSITLATCIPHTHIPNNFLMWTVPPLHLATQLLDQFGQAWFDSRASVVHPYSPTVHLPFWVLSYWRDDSHVLEAYLTWLKSHDWILQG
ncbi:hypothetical protein BDR07DRAFT_1482710 [Suillus spraguei]|nr:hypothetical protein BDR07DRAFT_1482710 [Suillus spraguei]